MLSQDHNGIWKVTGVVAQVSYPEAGNQSCLQIEENSFWFGHRNNVIYNSICRFKFQNNFADIGGGNGFQSKYLSEKLPGHNFFLIEPGYQGCLNARARGIKNVFNTTFQEFQFQKNQIGAAGLFDVLEHVEKDDLFLEELKRCLPVGSLIYLTVPAYQWLWSDVDSFAEHHRRYNKKALIGLADQTGLKMVYLTYFFSYLVIPSFFLRALPYRLNRKRRAEEILDKEKLQHDSKQSLITVFGFFNKMELKKISKGSLSFGASCLAILKT